MPAYGPDITIRVIDLGDRFGWWIQIGQGPQSAPKFAITAEAAFDAAVDEALTVWPKRRP